MSLKKKDLEITYSLRWKNGPKREDKEMSIISVYDIPATTLNFEMFKSYLLKNSGTAEHDVRVSYIMDNGKEYPIQSQTDFQVALYAFRRKARSGELIHLMLERISDQPIHKNLRHSNDVETQFDNMEPNSMASTCCNADIPPEWFISCIAQLKKEITEDITATVSGVVYSALSTVKPQVVSQPPCHHHSRKCKPEKRIRKITPHMMENNTDAKDLIKSLKLENKLDKLEYKAAKYREKRLALQNAPKSSDSEAGHSSSRSRSRDKGEKQEQGEPKMDAKPVNSQSAVPHMLGGEIYMHQWQVENTGEAPWTSKTHLQYTWGSKSLKPLNKIISVPYLKPGAKGTISVRLQVPNESGQYECYWQFMHKEHRFGHWLGCQIIVDPFDLKGNRSVLETARLAIENHFSADPKPDDSFIERAEDVAVLQNFLRGTDSEPPKKSPESANSAEALASIYKSLQGDKGTDHGDSVKNITEQLVREVTDNIERINLHENLDSDSNCSFYDNESLLDGYSSSKYSFKDEFVVVPVPKCFVLDGQENVDQNPAKPEEKDGQNAGTPKGHVLKKASLEQAGGSGTVAKKPAEKVLNTAENNFDDNNNTESVSGASGNSIKLRDEDLDNIVVITVPKDDQVKDGFIYVHVDGQKVLIPKNILKSELVNAAQELERSPSSRNTIGVIVDSNEALNKTPTPSMASTLTRQASRQSVAKEEDEHAGNTTDSVPVPEAGTGARAQKQDNIAIDMTMTSLKDNDFGHSDEHVEPSNYFEADNFMSHCSAAGSCFSDVNSRSEAGNSRLFIFPQNVPGYEVVHPVLDVSDNLYPNLTNEIFAPPSCATPYEPPLTAHPMIDHIANYQQTLPEHRNAPVPPTAPVDASAANNYVEGVPIVVQPANPDADVGVRSGVNQEMGAATGGPAPVHILPETLVSGAVNVASSAINTARSVINMMKPQAPGRWVNGHWVSSSPQTPREANLQALAEMGFWNRDLNATLLARFNDDLNRVVAELVQ